MAIGPQTLHGLNDLPVSFAAWVIDHGDGDAQPAAPITAALQRPMKGQPPPEQLTRDELYNITLYSLANIGASAARIYWETKLGFFDVKGVTIPIGVSVFPGELFRRPGVGRSGFSHDKGGHLCGMGAARASDHCPA